MGSAKIHQYQPQLYELNTRLSAFIKQGLLVNDAAPRALTTLDGYVAMNAMAMRNNPFVVREMEVQKRGKSIKEIDLYDESATAAVFELFVDFMQGLSIKAVSETLPPHVSPMSYQAYCDLMEKKGFAREITPNAVNDQVLAAWDVARQSYVRSHQRIAAVQFLASQTARDDGTQQAVQEAGGVLLDRLFRSASEFFEAEMKFAILLGGEPLKRTRKKIKESTFRKDTSVIQYLRDDHRYPSSYGVKEDTDFREKIAAYLG